VIALLGERSHRFNELRRAIDGISQRMLTLTLRQLERDGLVSRTVYDTVPPGVEYALTPLGESVLQPLGQLIAWAQHTAPMSPRPANATTTRPRSDALMVEPTIPGRERRGSTGPGLAQ